MSKMKLVPTIERIQTTVRLTSHIQRSAFSALISFLNPEVSGQADINSNFLNAFFMRPLPTLQDFYFT
jgi:hypothetical protein